MTYSLYYEKTSPTLTYIPTTVSGYHELLKAAFATTLDNPCLLSEGGLLGFALHCRYDLNKHTDLKVLANQLKGRDAFLLAVCKDLSMDISLQVLYSTDEDYHDILTRDICDLEGEGISFVDLYPFEYILRAYRGTPRVTEGDESGPDTVGYHADTLLEWVVERTSDGNVSHRVERSYPPDTEREICG